MKKNNFKQQTESYTFLRLKTVVVGFIVVITALTSCKPNAYLPNTIHTPLLKEKGEIRATVNFSNVQLAYAVTDKIGIMANGQFSTLSQTTTNVTSTGDLIEEDITKQTLGEIGVGYFKPIGTNGVFEVYGGGGYGNVNINSSSTFPGSVGNYQRTLTTLATKFFLQPSIGLTNEIFDLAFTPRLTGMMYDNRTLDGYPIDELDIVKILEDDGLNTLTGLHMFFEPGVTFRVGYKWIKFQTQIFYVAQISGEDISYIPLQFHIG